MLTRVQFQAPLADPYAEPAEEYSTDVDTLLRQVISALLDGYQNVPPLQFEEGSDEYIKGKLRLCLAYLRDRVGVPRDMTYPAARQLRAHLNWIASKLA